jgi:hypothetical protein
LNQPAVVPGVEQPVYEDFGVERNQVLEVAQDNALGTATVHSLRVLTNALVGVRQVIGGNPDLTAAGH